MRVCICEWQAYEPLLALAQRSAGSLMFVLNNTVTAEKPGSVCVSVRAGLVLVKAVQ